MQMGSLNGWVSLESIFNDGSEVAKASLVVVVIVGLPEISLVLFLYLTLLTSG